VQRVLADGHRPKPAVHRERGPLADKAVLARRAIGKAFIYSQKQTTPTAMRAAATKIPKAKKTPFQPHSSSYKAKATEAKNAARKRALFFV